MDSESRTCHPEFDEAGRIVRLRAPDGSVTEFTYDQDPGAPGAGLRRVDFTFQGGDGNVWTFEWDESRKDQEDP